MKFLKKYLPECSLELALALGAMPGFLVFVAFLMLVKCSCA